MLIHEMALSVNAWVNHMADYHKESDPVMYEAAREQMQAVQDNSHTPERAFGETMAHCRPKLAVITHCPFNQDTVIPAVGAVRRHYEGPLAWAWTGRS